MTVIPLDLSKPSFRAAYQLARAVAVTGDRAGADALFARLLWHVPASDGGFMGLTDCQMQAKIAADTRLSMRAVHEGIWNPGEWPKQEAAQVAA